MAIHVVNTKLVNVDKHGNIVPKSGSTIKQVIADHEMQQRVIPTPGVPNSTEWPTVADYLHNEDAAGYSLIHIDQYTIVTGSMAVDLELGDTVSVQIMPGTVHHYNGTTPGVPDTNIIITFTDTTQSIHTIRNTHTIAGILRVSFDGGATFFNLSQGEALDHIGTAVDNIILRSNVANCAYQILTLED